MSSPMLMPPGPMRVLVATKPVDFRKGMNGLAALVQEHCFYSLYAPILRVAGWDTPYPHALEWSYFPGPARVADALRQVMEAS